MSTVWAVDDRSMAVFNFMVGSLFLFAALLMGGLKRIDDRPPGMAVPFNFFMVGLLMLPVPVRGASANLSLVRAETSQDFHGVVAILLFAFTYL